MDFLSGAMLWGAAAASVPVLLHLTGRAKPVLHRFPAMRFLARSQRTSSRALRIKHILLLLLRMAALALLALTLARPLWPFLLPDAAALNGTVRGDYVLVLDASMSMQHKEQETSRFEHAREQALRFLDRLAPDARVALLAATEDAGKVQGRFTLNHDLVREQLRQAKPTGRGLSLTRALEASRGICARSDGRETPQGVVFLTDLQLNAYTALQARGPLALPQGERLPALTLVDVGSEEARNGAVLEARIPGPAVAADQPLTLSAKVRPLDPQRSFPVEFYVDGVKVAQRAVDPKGAESVEVHFSFPAGAPGTHSGVLKLAQNDGLAMDQEACIAYQAGLPPRLLLIEKPGDGARKGSAFFLRAALETPSAVSASGLAVTVATPAELHAGMLTGQQVVALADPGSLSEAAWSALARFVEGGGGLFVWLGPHTDPATLRRYGFSEVQAHQGLLPGRIGARSEAPGGKALGVRVAQTGHPLLARFTPGVLSELRGLHVKEYVQVEPVLQDTRASTVLALSNGAPLLMEKLYGRGRVLLCTVPPEPGWSDLVRTGPVFVTLALEAGRFLSGRGQEAEVRLGRPLVLAIDQPPQDGMVFWRAPDSDESVPLRIEEREAAGVGQTEDARPGTLLVPSVEAPGFHRFTWKPAPGRPSRSLLVAANPESSESNLARADAQTIEKVLAPWPVTLVKDIDEMPQVAGEAATGRELTAPLLLLVLVVLFLESYLANRLYKPAVEETAAS